jgi:DNA-binding protein HU-beta
MKKAELVAQVAEKAQTTKAAAERMLRALFDSGSGAIADAVRAGREVSVPGFGKFRPKRRQARTARNPRTGAQVSVPERTVIAFTPSRGLRDALADEPAGAGKKASATKKAGTAKKASSAKKAPAAKKAGTAKKAPAAKKAGTAKKAPAAKKAGAARKAPAAKKK